MIRDNIAEDSTIDAWTKLITMYSESSELDIAQALRFRGVMEGMHAQQVKQGKTIQGFES